VEGKGRKTPRSEKMKFTWDVAKVEGGSKFGAYVAGPHVRAICHEGKKVKACLREYTGTKDCPGCLAGKKHTVISYMPVYRAVDKHEMVCGFHEEQEDTLEKLALLQGVMIGREDGFGCGLWINPAAGLPKYEPESLTRKRPRCIAAWLPTLWRYVGSITGEQLLAERPVEHFESSNQEPKIHEQVKGPNNRVVAVTMELGDLKIDVPVNSTPQQRNELWAAAVRGLSDHTKMPSSNGKH